MMVFTVCTKGEENCVHFEVALTDNHKFGRKGFKAEQVRTRSCFHHYHKLRWKGTSSTSPDGNTRDLHAHKVWEALAYLMTSEYFIWSYMPIW